MEREPESLPPTRAGFEAAFEPRHYLNEYFAAGVDDEDVFTARFIAGALRGLPDGLLAHEFGGGPALYSVAALAAKAREIHFSDVVPANLDEIQRWRLGGPEAFDWTPYIRLALESEGSPADDAAVIAREAAMRRKLTRLMLCDAQSAAPLGPGAPVYDVVAANHCTDVAATSVPEWFQVLKNVSTLVAPGGTLIVTVTSGTSTYNVEGHVFRCADLSPEEVHTGFLLAGYDPVSISVQAHPVAGQREYTGIVAAVGRKSPVG